MDDETTTLSDDEIVSTPGIGTPTMPTADTDDTDSTDADDADQDADADDPS